jgi:hypothetical protein
MQHASMNIRDKRGLYAQITRVLRPGGRLALHEVLEGPGGPPHFPVPWAPGPEASFLISPGEAEALLGDSGLMLEHWKDDTEASVAFFEEMLARHRASGPPSLGTHLLLFGPDSPVIFANYGRSLRENRCRVVQAVAVKAP